MSFAFGPRQQQRDGDYYFCQWLICLYIRSRFIIPFFLEIADSTLMVGRLFHLNPPSGRTHIPPSGGDLSWWPWWQMFKAMIRSLMLLLLLLLKELGFCAGLMRCFCFRPLSHHPDLQTPQDWQWILSVQSSPIRSTQKETEGTKWNCSQCFDRSRFSAVVCRITNYVYVSSISKILLMW